MDDNAAAERLRALVVADDWLMTVLRVVRSLGLAQWCVGAGVIRNRVWDQLAGKLTASPLADVDVAYFDVGDLSPERDAALQALLAAAMPAVPWEVTNQAGVHRWFAREFGHEVAPLRSLHEAVASWPEYVTAVAVTLSSDDAIDVIAPYGLDDLFTMTVRHNPVRASTDTYRRRVASKRYQDRWPGVTVLPPEC